jgi:hypothetical protein
MSVKKQWWFKCEECDKSIYRKVKRNLICQGCARKKKMKNCLQCGEQFYPKKTIRKYCSTSCSSTHTLTGVKKTKEHREILSKAAKLNSNGLIKCKFYKIFNPYLGKEVSVQGTYELKYAEFLNENDIKWDRGKYINIPYFSDINRTYYPDFYLVDEDVYIETKGYFFEVDKIKMNNVINQNKDKVIKILLKEDLIKLGIEI